MGTPATQSKLILSETPWKNTINLCRELLLLQIEWLMRNVSVNHRLCQLCQRTCSLKCYLSFLHRLSLQIISHRRHSQRCLQRPREGCRCNKESLGHLIMVVLRNKIQKMMRWIHSIHQEAIHQTPNRAFQDSTKAKLHRLRQESTETSFQRKETAFPIIPRLYFRMLT